MPDEPMSRDEQKSRFGFVWDDCKSFGDAHDFWKISEKIIKHAPPGSTVVEVGCFEGRNLCCLGLFAKEANKGLKIFGCDNNDIGGTGNLTRNIAAAGLESIVTFIGKPSVEASKMFADESCWALFIDDDHRHEQVEEGIRAWMPKLTRDGWMLGHDALFFSVAEPVHALFGVENVITEHIDIWIVPKMEPRANVNIAQSSYRPKVIPGSWKPLIVE